MGEGVTITDLGDKVKLIEIDEKLWLKLAAGGYPYINGFRTEEDPR